MVELKGIVKKLYYTSDRFSAGVLELSQGTVRFSGSFAINEGDKIIASGDYTHDKKYGKGFKIEKFSYDTELNREGLIEVISKSKNIVGVGPAKAKKFVESLAKIQDIFDLSPEELSKKSGLAREACQAIQEEMKYKKLHTEILAKLDGYNITFNTVNKLVEKYGPATISILQTNPYQIIGQVPGFAFKKCDEIALKLGVAKGDPHRIKSCVLFLIKEFQQQKGWSYVPQDELLEKANLYLHIDTLDAKHLIAEQIRTLISDGEVVVYKKTVSLRDTFDKESWLSEYFKVVDETGLVIPEDLYSKAPFISLNSGQREALTNAIRFNKSVITGSGGTGKSFLTNSLLTFFSSLGLRVTLCSPTGKAAKRLEHYTGQPATTIHRLLGYKGSEFALDNPLLTNTNVFIVDEVSMCGVDLLYHLLSSVPRSSTVVLIGDPNQLPSVDYGNVLYDVISNYPTPKVKLTECLRQAGELKENCNKILEGKILKTSSMFSGDTKRKHWYKVISYTTPEEIQQYIEGAYNKSIEEKFGYNLLFDVQLLTPTHEGPLGTQSMNKILQRVIQKKLYNVVVPTTEEKKVKFYVGDKVINKKNNYNKDIMNGSIGVIKNIVDAQTYIIRFEETDVELSKEELEHIYLAYALTVHSYQGDQVKMAIMICHKSHCFQHNRNLLYTAATRAQQSFAIVGDLWAMTEGVKKFGNYNRNSLLPLLK